MKSQLITQLEKQLKTKFEKVDVSEITKWKGEKTAKYSINRNGNISGICIANFNLKEIPESLSFCSYLNVLNFQNNLISDISVLKKLNSLIRPRSSMQNDDLTFHKIRGFLYEMETENVSQGTMTTKSEDFSFLTEFNYPNSLNLSGNKIHDISVLEEVKEIRELDLSNNQILNISALNKLDKLEILDLSQNEITDISPIESFFLKPMIICDFTNNPLNKTSKKIAIKYKPEIIRELEKELNITFQKGNINVGINYNDVKNAFFLTDKNEILIELWFSEMEIIRVPKTLAKSKTVLKLTMSGCDIKDVSALKDMKLLNELNLENNQISDASCLKDLKKIKNLNLSNNNISDVSFLENLRDIETLNLSNNKITNISFLRNLRQIKILNLNFNKIKDIIDVVQYTKLHTLQVKGNKIDSLPENLFSNKKDVFINLQNNKIKKVSDEILKHLYISGLHIVNNLKLEAVKNQQFELAASYRDEEQNYLADASYSYKELAYDFFHKNPIESPPLEIIKQGEGAVKNYFEQLEKEKTEYLFETKLLIIGDGGSGKTSFALKIKDKNAKLPKDKDTTLGIEVTKWAFDIDHHIRGKQTMYANLWDFGGQKLYQGTHQIFFSQKSFYVLLDDTREEKTDFAYWLNTVEQLAGDDSKLLIVINKKHEHVPLIDKNGLKGRFGNLITNFFTINLLKDKVRIVELQSELKYLLPKLKGIGDALPASWVYIRKDLFEINENFISYDRYLKICKKHKTNLTKLDFISDYFNRIGVFSHYYDDKALKQRVYLNSNWLVTTVYELLNHKKVKESNGIISEKELRIIWNGDELYSETDHLSRIMHRFGLMYESDKGTYIVPAHLSLEQPYKVWQYETEREILQFVYEFDKYMPRGIMPRLIVALNHLITNQNLVWNKGVNIKLETTYAEIKETYDKSNKFLIRIIGNQKKELLGVINNEFEKLLEPYKKLHYEKLVPCICSECKKFNNPHFFKYSSLIKRKENTNRSM